MPVIELETGELWEALYAIFALIAFPEDERQRKKLHHGLLGVVLKGSMGLGAVDPRDLDRDAINILSQSGSVEHLFLNSQNPKDNARQNAAGILTLVLSLNEQAPVFASVRQVMRFLKHNNRTSLQAGERSQLMAHWSRYKDIAHFIAAFRLCEDWQTEGRAHYDARFGDVGTTEDSLEDGIEELFLLSQPKEEKDARALQKFTDASLSGYTRLFATADAIRRDGEQHYARGQKSRHDGKPLLDPATTWRLPDYLEIPEVKVEYPTVPPEIMAFLLKGSK